VDRHPTSPLLSVCRQEQSVSDSDPTEINSERESVDKAERVPPIISPYFFTNLNLERAILIHYRRKGPQQNQKVFTQRPTADILAVQSYSCIVTQLAASGDLPESG
jgi:hypothetical protein